MADKTTRPAHTRSRSGCLTCRRRKKKCDGITFPCNNCVRLQIHCETGVGLVWEDDARREGMRRRGPPQLKRRRASQAVPPQRPVEREHDRPYTADDGRQARDVTRSSQTVLVPSSVASSDIIRRNPPSVSSNLSPNEAFLLGRYVDLFSQTYPTCSDPSNPFVSIFLPLANQSPVVLDALLALSGAQTWNECGFSMGETTLRLRQRALAGCQGLLVRATRNAVDINHDASWLAQMSEEDFLLLMASCILLLLYEKIVGEGKGNWLPHLQFMARVFANFTRHKTGRSTGPVSPQQLRSPQVFQFIHNLFLYNDLVHSISRETSTLSDYYLRLECEAQPTLTDPLSCPNDLSFLSATFPTTTATPHDDRRWFPHLIARISAGDANVTDADITSWDGRIDWFPSFSLLGKAQTETERAVANSHMPTTAECTPIPNNSPQPPFTGSCSEEQLISDIYRIAARVYRIHVFSRKGLVNDGAHPLTVDTRALACHAAHLMLQLPGGSTFENTLLWPIGIIGRELTSDHVEERSAILNRLLSLERRFHMRHFERARGVLREVWQRKDAGDGEPEDSDIANKVLLLG